MKLLEKDMVCVTFPVKNRVAFDRLWCEVAKKVTSVVWSLAMDGIQRDVYSRVQQIRLLIVNKMLS